MKAVKYIEEQNSNGSEEDLDVNGADDHEEDDDDNEVLSGSCIEATEHLYNLPRLP